MARALAREGARVTVFCNMSSALGPHDGVQYQPASAWPNFAKETPHDVCVVQRTLGALSQRTNARVNLLWCHDLALGRDRPSLRNGLWNLDRIIVLSNYMRQQYKEVFGLDDDAFFLSRNGVDLDLFGEVTGPGIERDRNKLIYAARPERGLDVLLRDIMPKLLVRNADLRLYIAGYDHRPPEWQTFYSECDALAEQLGDRVVRLGCLSKRELYRHYCSGRVYVYPTPSPAHPLFHEISCISAMECQAAGLPIVTSSRGALPETIAPGAGLLIADDTSETNEYLEQFVQGVLRLTNDDAMWDAASTCGRARAQSLDWSGVAREWLAEFERLIRRASDSPERLVRHFVRTSDVVAAKHVLSKAAATSGISSSVARQLTKQLLPWSFVDEGECLRKPYRGLGRLSDPLDFEATLRSPQFALVNHWLGRQDTGVSMVLHYGRAFGSDTIGLAHRFPHLRFHGVEEDQATADVASQMALKLGVAERVAFTAWPSDPQAVGPAMFEQPQLFDAAILQEVLQAVTEPWAILGSVERHVRAGGIIHLTVPFGPWEFGTTRIRLHREHVWQIDAHDLRDMLGSKPELELASCYAGDNPVTGEPQGWWVVTYAADHAPIPPIDLERHSWLQRPKQSLSAAIIAGPDAEETLHWTLRSICDIADEVIVADCGMSEEARRITSQYAVRMVAGVDPRAEGFESARNLALDACSCDWCLWIDTDEKLLGTRTLEKYLRESVYHGYAIPQHHFACDAALPTDTPVRLFRRRPYKGRVVRFWGAIHEHPELTINQGAGPNVALTDVNIAHVGYLVESGRRSRFSRNLPLLELDQQRYPERLLQKYFIMRDNMHTIRHSLQRNGGRVTNAMQVKCRETVGLYRKYFLGNGRDVNHEALEYYSEALTVLGEGFEAVFQIETDKVEAKPNGARRYRFASTEDFCAELKQAAIEKASPFDSKWW
jgi:hypothetical protein